MNSRQKGKRGELEFAELLRSYGHTARRGVQFKGGVDSPDVVCSTIPTVHFEVKRTERTDLYGWLEQATEDAGSKMPVVVHRKSHAGWVAVLHFDDLMELLDAAGRRKISCGASVEVREQGSQQCTGQSPSLESQIGQTGSDASLRRQTTE